jgi:hypothetical protein
VLRECVSHFGHLMPSVTLSESIPVQWCRHESAVSRMKPLGCFGHGCKLRSTGQGGVKVLTGLEKITVWRDRVGGTSCRRVGL